MDGRVGNRREIESEVLVKDEFVPSLDGIEGFSHLVIIFWMDRVDKSPQKVHPRGRMDLPEQGVFATKSPFRPNPMGITTVKLLERKGGVLRVRGLDCYNGTPVLDIKPYTPMDREVENPKFPEWIRSLDEEKKGR